MPLVSSFSTLPASSPFFPFSFSLSFFLPFLSPSHPPPASLLSKHSSFFPIHCSFFLQSILSLPCLSACFSSFFSCVPPSSQHSSSSILFLISLSSFLIF